MVNVLAAIVEHKRQMISNLADFDSSQLEKSSRSFYNALAQPRFGFIMECKKASPSKGLIRENFDIEEIIDAYEPYADAISVLTEERFFRGGFDVLEKSRKLTDKPLLCKDFVLEPKQVRQARACGADAVLLMLSVLNDRDYSICAEAANELDMDILTEVHDEEELARAIRLGAKIIGVNNRDLKSLKTDLAHTKRLAPLVPEDCLIVTESGIGSHQDLLSVAPYADACLVGSSLMASADVKQAANRLVYGDIKVCGVTCEEDLALLEQGPASQSGIIFVPHSKRYVPIETSNFQAYCAKRPLPKRQALVGVFQNQSLEDIQKAVELFSLDKVQLHGAESISEIQAIKASLPDVAVSKVVHLRTSSDLVQQGETAYLREKCQEIIELVSLEWLDEVLLDSELVVDEALQQGGTGMFVGADRLKTLLASIRELGQDSCLNKLRIAGGLTPDNIPYLKAMGLSHLDIAGSSESSPGKKSAERLEHLYDACLLGSRVSY